MPTETTRPIADDTLPDATLHLAFDLGNTEWTFACTTAVAVAPRVRTMPARDLPRLVAEFEAARRHFGLPATTPIRTCYEAGRDGFWLHRARCECRRTQCDRRLGQHRGESPGAP